MNKFLLSTIAGGLSLTLAVPHHASAQAQRCRAVDFETETVLRATRLTYDSSFRCTNAPDNGSYRLRVEVSNDSDSAQAVRLHQLVLRSTTPRPRGTAPSASAETAGLPVTIAPGGSATFAVTGDYELVSTDEGDKANLHLRVRGAGTADGDRFRIGINAHLRG